MSQEKGLFERIDAIVMKVLKFISYFAVIFLVLIMFMCLFNTIGEKLAKAGVEGMRGVPYSTEWIQYWHIPTVFLTLAYVTLDPGHTKIDFVTKKYSNLLQRIFGVFANLLGCAITGFISWRGWSVLLMEQIKFHNTISQTATSFPQWPFGLVYCIGFTLTSFAFLWACVRIIKWRSLGTPATDDKKQDEEADENVGILDY